MQNMLLTSEQVAEIFQVHPETIKTWLSRGNLPKELTIKIGGGRGTRRFVRTKLEEFINNGSLPTQ